MRRVVLLLAGILLLVLLWVLLGALESWFAAEREERAFRAWESRARQQIGQIQAHARIERQHERIVQRFRDRLSDLLAHLGPRRLAGALVERAARLSFPRDLSWPTVYLFRAEPGTRKWRMVRGVGLASQGAVLLEPVMAGVWQAHQGQVASADAQRKCRGVFGDYLTTEVLGRHGIGRVLAGTFRGEPAWIYWNTLRYRHRVAGLLLVILPRQPDLPVEAELRSLLAHWRPRGALPLFRRWFLPPGQRQVILHPRLARWPAFQNDLPGLEQRLSALPPGVAGRIGRWWAIRQGLGPDRPFEVCLLARGPRWPPVLAGHLRRGVGWLLLAAGLAVGGALAGGWTWPVVRLRAGFLLILGLLAGVPLVLGAVYSVERVPAATERRLAVAREEVDRFFRRLDAAGEHRKNQYRKVMERQLTDWQANWSSRPPRDFLSRAVAAYRAAELPFQGIFVFDQAGTILHALSRDLAPEATRAVVDHLQDWAIGGFSELRDQARSLGILSAIPLRTRMFKYLVQTLNPDRGLGAMILWQLGQAEAVSLEGTRFYKIHTALVREGRLQAFIFVIWRAEADFRRFLTQALAERNARGEPHTCAAVQFERGALVPVAPHPRAGFWRTAAGRTLWQAFEGYLTRRAALAGTRRGFHLTVQPSLTAPTILFGAVAPADPFRDASRWEGMLDLVGLSLLGLAVVGLGGATIRRFLDPLRCLADSLWAASRGDLRQAPELGVTREFADLSATFQEMMEGLRERRHLSRFVSGALAADPLARASDGANSRRWYGTVLVSDIRRFTTLSESYPATEVMAMLNGHFDALAQEVQSRGGTIDKFIGDALVAVFFAQDEADRSHRRRAVETAVAMRERGRAIQEARRAAGKFPYDFGIGLASGELIGLTIGRSLQRWEHQVFGEAVRRAEVLEGLSKQARHTGIIADGAIAEETPEFGWVQLSAQNAWEMTGLPGGRS